MTTDTAPDAGHAVEMMTMSNERLLKSYELVCDEMSFRVGAAFEDAQDRYKVIRAELLRRLHDALAAHAPEGERDE